MVQLKKRIALLLSITMILTFAFGTFTTASARASDYFDSYVAYITKNSDKTITVDFTANATGTMTTLGASSIQIQKSTTSGWSTVYTFTTSNTTGLQKSSAVTYTKAFTTPDTFSAGTYRAYVTFYAKNSSGSENKYYTTSSVTIS